MFILLTFATEEDREKFELLFVNYKKLLLYHAYSILGDYNLAEDAVSEAYIRIYKNMAKIDDDIESPRTLAFLSMIVKNRALYILERQQKYGGIIEDAESEAGIYDIEEGVLSGVVTGDMLKIVAALREELRAPFLLKYAFDYSHREIAYLLDISENNVTVRIHRAKNKLSKLFREAGYVYGT